MKTKNRRTNQVATAKEVYRLHLRGFSVKGIADTLHIARKYVPELLKIGKAVVIEEAVRAVKST